MSFWKTFGFQEASAIDKIMERGEFTLEELLDEDELLQETKAQNRKLIDFLCEEPQLRALLDYATVEPDDDADDRRKFKFPFLAAEILASEVWSICDAFYQHEDLLVQLYSFLRQDAPLNPQVAANSARVALVLLQKKVPETVAFLRQQPDIVERFVVHLSNGNVMEVLLKLIACEDSDYGAGTLAWLRDAKLIPKLVEKFAPGSDADAAENAAQALVDIIAVSAAYIPPAPPDEDDEDSDDSAAAAAKSSDDNNNDDDDADEAKEDGGDADAKKKEDGAADDAKKEEDSQGDDAAAAKKGDDGKKDEDGAAAAAAAEGEEEDDEEEDAAALASGVSPLLAQLESNSVASKLFDYILAGGRSPALLHGLSVVIELLKRHMSEEYDWTTPVEGLPRFVGRVVARFPELHALLAEQRPDAKMMTLTIGEKVAPLGFHRLKLIELFAVAARLNFACVERALVTSGAFTTSFQLGFKYRWNNFLHGLVHAMIDAAMAGPSTELKLALLRSRKPAAEGSSAAAAAGGDDGKKKDDAEDDEQGCGLLELMCDASDANEAAVAAGKPRLGYMGFLTRMADAIERAPDDEVRALCAADKRYAAFEAGPLRQTRDRDATALAGFSRNPGVGMMMDFTGGFAAGGAVPADSMQMHVAGLTNGGQQAAPIEPSGLADSMGGEDEDDGVALVDDDADADDDDDVDAAAAEDAAAAVAEGGDAADAAADAATDDKEEDKADAATTDAAAAPAATEATPDFADFGSAPIADTKADESKADADDDKADDAEDKAADKKDEDKADADAADGDDKKKEDDAADAKKD